MQKLESSLNLNQADQQEEERFKSDPTTMQWTKRVPLDKGALTSLEEFVQLSKQDQQTFWQEKFSEALLKQVGQRQIVY